MEVTSPPGETFKCEHCDNYFKSENGLKIHIGKSHKTLKEVLSPEKVREDSKETSLSLYPVRDTNREETVIEEEQEAPTLPEEVIVQRHFSIECLCNFSRLNEHLECDLNKDVGKNFKSCEKEKISKKLTRYDVIITGLKGSRVQWPQNKHN